MTHPMSLRRAQMVQVAVRIHDSLLRGIIPFICLCSSSVVVQDASVVSLGMALRYLPQQSGLGWSRDDLG